MIKLNISDKFLLKVCSIFLYNSFFFPRHKQVHLLDIKRLCTFKWYSNKPSMIFRDHMCFKVRLKKVGLMQSIIIYLYRSDCKKDFKNDIEENVSMRTFYQLECFFIITDKSNKR